MKSESLIFFIFSVSGIEISKQIQQQTTGKPTGISKDSCDFTTKKLKNADAMWILTMLNSQNLGSSITKILVAGSCSWRLLIGRSFVAPLVEYRNRRLLNKLNSTGKYSQGFADDYSCQRSRKVYPGYE